MEPWQNWGIVCLVGAGAYYYYSQSSPARRGRIRAPLTPPQDQRRGIKLQEDGKDRQKGRSNTSGPDQISSDAADLSSASTPADSNNRTKRRKGGKRPPSQLGQSLSVDVVEGAKGETGSSFAEEDDLDNHEFAKQLSGLKAGVSLKKPSEGGDGRKTKKVGKHNEMVPPSDLISVNNGQDISRASSTTGADGDDDLSLSGSPHLRATNDTKPSGDVSDMLEAAPKGPSILRLTEPVQPPKAALSKSKPSKPPHEPETKKQRQNRRKNEEKKLIKQEIEKERRVLLERQLRTAREAEGRPAKNGLGQSHPPVKNPWASHEHIPAGPAPKDAEDDDTLLDTFDQPSISAAQNTDVTNSTHPEADRAWNHHLPSEEEQMRLLNLVDDGDGWNTVEKGTKGRKRNAKVAQKVEAPENKSSVSDASSSMGNGRSDLTVNESLLGGDHTGSTTSVTSESGIDASQSGNDPLRKNSNGTANAPPDHEDLEQGRNKPRSHQLGNGDSQRQEHPIAKRIRIRRTIDRKVWNHDNIHQHPDYEPEWPHALLGHPLDSDWKASEDDGGIPDSIKSSLPTPERDESAH